MQKVVTSGLLRRRRSWASFTLIELLTVIAIIAILAALTLAAASGLMNTAARNRAKAEIQAISTALESYKIDNGVYPVGNPTASVGSQLLGPPSASYSLDPSTLGGNYQIASQALYEALSGKINFADIPVGGTKSYMNFKTSQLGNYKTSAGTGYSASTATYIQDPWGYSYGYSTGDNKTPQVQYPFNGSGFFDLWSTGGLLADPNATTFATNTWITNWK